MIAGVRRVYARRIRGGGRASTCARMGIVNVRWGRAHKVGGERGQHACYRNSELRVRSRRGICGQDWRCDERREKPCGDARGARNQCARHPGSVS